MRREVHVRFCERPGAQLPGPTLQGTNLRGEVHHWHLGCQMAVEMIIDHWNPSKRRYRTETFCYGPSSCPLYRSGPARKVPGRHGMSYTEEDCVDDEATSRRGPDE